jgi:hypothetical protein
MESCVKNCGVLIHDEVATKAFMEEMRELVKQTTDDNIKNKVRFFILPQPDIPVLGIRIRRMRMFLGLPDPEPVRGTDPDPSLFAYIMLAKLNFNTKF